MTLTPARRIAVVLVSLSAISCHAYQRGVDRLGLYRRIYKMCGFSDELAAKFERVTSTCAHMGILTQHLVLRRWARGEIGFEQLKREMKEWYLLHLEMSFDLITQEFEKPAEEMSVVA